MRSRYAYLASRSLYHSLLHRAPWFRNSKCEWRNFSHTPFLLFNKFSIKWIDMHCECHRYAFYVPENATNSSHFQSKHKTHRTHPHTLTLTPSGCCCSFDSTNSIKRESRAVSMPRNSTGLPVKSEYTCSLMNTRKTHHYHCGAKNILNKVAKHDTRLL